MKQFKSFYKEVGGNEGGKCNYPIRLDTYRVSVVAMTVNIAMLNPYWALEVYGIQKTQVWPILKN